MEEQKDKQKISNIIFGKAEDVFRNIRLFLTSKKIAKIVKTEKKAIENVRTKLAELYGTANSEQRTVNSESVDRGNRKDLVNEKKKTVEKKKKLVFVPLSEIAKNSTYSKNYINFSARQGKLKAKKIKGVWHTTEAWLAEFTKKSKAKKNEFKEKLSHDLGGNKKFVEEVENESLTSRAEVKLPRRIAKEEEVGSFPALMAELERERLEKKKAREILKKNLKEVVAPRAVVLWARKSFAKIRNDAKTWFRELVEMGDTKTLAKFKKAKLKDFWKLNYAKPAAAMIALVLLMAIGNITKADLANLGDQGKKKIYFAYNAGADAAAKTVSHVNEAAGRRIAEVKIGKEKFVKIAQDLLRRKKIIDFEKNSGLSLKGDESAKGEIAGVETQDFASLQTANAKGDETGGRVLAATTIGAAQMNVGDIEVSAYLMDGSDKEIANGEYEVRFGIYTTDRIEQDPYPSDTDKGTRVWEETQTVTVENGLLKTYLGAVMPLPANFNFAASNYYIGLRVGEDAEMTPRKRIGAVPLARTAMNIAGQSIGNGAGNIPLSNGTLNTNLNADLLDGQHSTAFQVAGSYQPAGTYDNYVAWKLQSTATDAGQKIKANKGAIFAGGNGILTSRLLNTLTISLDPAYSPTFTDITVTTINATTLDLGTNTITDENFTGDWNFNAGDLTNINSLTAITGNFTTTNITTANITNIDLGTNTITDENFTGNWNFNGGDLSGVGDILPAADLTYNLGSPALQWNNIFVGTLDVGTNTITDQNMTGNWNFNAGNLTNITALTATTGNFTTANIGTADFGTNTILDGNLNGDWSFNAGTLSNIASATVTGNFNLTASTNLIFGGITSLGETTSPTDSGAYMVGVNDEFSNSAATNVQGVLNDLDNALAIGGPGALWTLAAGTIYPTNPAHNFAVNGTNFVVEAATGNITANGDFQFTGDQSITGTGTITINPTGNLYLQSASYFMDEAGNLTVAKIIAPEMEYSGNITIDANSAAGTTTVTVTNQDGVQTANLVVEGDINVQGGKITLASGETIDAETADTVKITSGGDVMTILGDAAGVKRFAIYDSTGANEVGHIDSDGNIQMDGTATFANQLTIQSNGANITGDVVIIGDVDATTGTITTLDGTTLTYGTANLTTIDLGTNTITDQNFHGNWNFNSAALTGISSIDTINVSSTALTFVGAGSISTGAGMALNLDAGTNGAINIGSVSSGNVNIAAEGTGNILLAGGSLSTGCTIDNATGNLDCSGNITGSSSGTVGFWTRTGTNISPAAVGDDLYLVGSDELLGVGYNPTTFSTGTVAAFNGNVGIGTTSPGEKLNISSTTPSIRLSSGAAASNTQESGIYSYNTTNSKKNSGIEFWTDGYSDTGTIKFLTAFGSTYSERMRINSGGNVSILTGILTVSGTGNSSFAGNVGIGTTSPGTTLALKSASGVNPLSVVDNNGDTISTLSNIGAMVLQYPGSSRSSLSLLQKTGSGSNCFGSVYFGVAGATPGAEIAACRETSDTTGRMIFYTSSAMRIYLDGSGNIGIGGTANTNPFLYVKSTGNVGIGTTNPLYKLEVDGTFKANTTVPVFGAYTLTIPATGTAALGTGATNQMAYWSTANTLTGSDNFFFDGTNVGIGTTAVGTYKLNVNGSINATSYYAGGSPISPLTAGTITGQTLYWNGSAWTANVNLFNDNTKVGIGTTLPSQLFQVNNSGSTAFVVTSGGNVGIGTTSPGSSLQVNGNAVIGYVAGTATTVNGLAISGNVGIGTTSPLYDLQLGGGLVASSTRTLSLGIDGSDNSIEAAIQTNQTSPNSSLDLISAGRTGSWHGIITFQTSNNTAAPEERMRIDQTGNVGIGTTEPVAKLQVSGTTGNGTTNANGMIINTTNIPSNNGLSYSGLLAIPAFNTASQNNANVYGVKISPTHTGTFTTTNAYGLYVDATAVSSGIVTNNYAAVFNGGNVGIGTTNPLALLSVGVTSQFQVSSSGAIAAATGVTSSGTITFSGLAGANGPVYTTAGGVLNSETYLNVTRGGSGAGSFTQNYLLKGNGTNAFSPSTIYDDGTNVGIGTTAVGTYKLNVNGSINATSYYAGGSPISPLTAGTITGQTLYWNGSAWTANVNLFNDNTNVGIGTTAPTNLLDVAGIARVDSLYVDGLVSTSSGGPNGTLDLDDNFDDNDISDWEAATGTVTAGSGVVTVTMSGTGTADRIRKLGLTSRTEVWASFDMNLNSGHSGWDNGESFQGTGPTQTSGYRPLTYVGMIKSGGVIYWRMSYVDDSTAITHTTSSIAVTEDVSHHIVVHWKAATTAGANNGIAEYWVDGVLASSVTNIDVDTFTNTGFLLGNNYMGEFNSVLVLDNAKLGSSGLAPGTVQEIGYAGIFMGGSVGIGTTAPGSKLTISGGVGIGTTNPASVYLSTAAPDGGMIIEGNVGIGTTNPLYKLEVDGTFKVSTTVPVFGAYTLTIPATGTVALGTGTANYAAYWSDANTLTAEQFLNVTRGGSGAGSFTQNYLLKGNGTNAFSPSTIYDDGTNVGIGTTANLQKIQIAGTGYFEGGVMIGANSGDNQIDDSIQGTGSTTLYIGNRAIATVGAGGNINGTTNLIAKFTGTTSVGDSRIFDDGTNIGIGTTNPLTYLNIGNAIYMTALGGNVGIGTTSPSGRLDIHGVSTGTGINTQWADSTGAAKVSILDNGNVGIGTTNPLYKLEVNGNVGIGGTVNISGLSINSAVYTDGSRNLTSTVPTSGILGYWQRNGTSLAPATISDYVGIGTTAPSQLFQVNNSGTSAFVVTSNGNVGIGTTSPSGRLDIHGVSTGTGINTQWADSTGAAKVSILDNGNVGIGTTAPSQLFQVNNSGSNPVVITSGGNVGIGITSPTQKFSVVGAGLFSTGVYVGVDTSTNNLISTSLTGTGSTTLYIGNRAIATAGVGGNINGTLNYLAKFTPDGTSLGNSQIFDNGASVGIGTTSLSGVKFKIANTGTGSSSVSDSYNDQSKIASAVNSTVSSSQLHVSETTCGTYSVLDADGNTYNTVLVNGRCWLDRNLGATTVAANTLPSANTSYGYLFQWGRSRDGHQQTLYSNGANSATTSTLSSTDTVPDPDTAKFIMSPNTPWDWRSPQSPNAATLWAGANGGANNPCPTGFRVPTQPEWSAVATAIGLTTANCGGTDCRVTAASSLLHLPPAGYRVSSNGSLYGQGSYGFYWSSGPDGTTAYYLYFDSTNVYPANYNYRAGGFSVRCVKD